VLQGLGRTVDLQGDSGSVYLLQQVFQIRTPIYLDDGRISAVRQQEEIP
jgi:hypothetical protein